MKRILIISMAIFLSFAQNLRDLSDGRYSSSDEGQYRPGNSGAYNGRGDGSYRPDDSGAYVGDDSGRYTGTFEKYVHTADQFGGSGSSGGGSRGSGVNRDLRKPSSGNLIRVGASDSLAGNKVPSGSGIGARVKNIVISSGGSGIFDSAAARKVSPGHYNDEGKYAIIRQEEEAEQDGYHYLYETENKILGEEQGKLANVGTENEAMQANGYFEYTGPDNVIYRVEYTANENGFVPSAAHIPTPPPIPEAILRSLEYQRSVGKL